MTERLTSWPVDRYMPKQLQKLQLALEDLHLASSPGQDTEDEDLETRIQQTNEPSQAPPGTYDRVAARCRRKLNKILNLCDTLADEIEVTIRGGEDVGPRSTRCPRCNRGQRIAARFCDGCGGDLRSQAS